MGNKFIALAALMLFVTGIGQAIGQVPGYLGRRNLLGAGISLSPQVPRLGACYQTWAGNNGCERGGHRLGKTYEFSVERVTSRRATFGLIVGVRRAGNTYIALSDTTFPGPPTPSRILSTSYAGKIRIFPFVMAGNVAPYGPYVDLKFGLMRSKEYLVSDPQRLGEDNLVKTGLGAVLGLGAGRNSFLTDRLILDWGLRAGVYLRAGHRYSIPLKPLLVPEVLNLYIRLVWLA